MLNPHFPTKNLIAIMTAIKRAKQYASEFIVKHKEHEAEVKDLLQLMIDEIESGESAENEYNHFVTGCEDLLNAE
jgi:hypothetical protein